MFWRWHNSHVNRSLNSLGFWWSDLWLPVSFICCQWTSPGFIFCYARRRRWSCSLPWSWRKSFQVWRCSRTRFRLFGISCIEWLSNNTRLSIWVFMIQHSMIVKRRRDLKTGNRFNKHWKASSSDESARPACQSILSAVSQVAWNKSLNQKNYSTTVTKQTKVAIHGFSWTCPSRNMVRLLQHQQRRNH